MLNAFKDAIRELGIMVDDHCQFVVSTGALTMEECDMAK